MNQRPVLLIEDDCDLLRLMGRAFERDGWRVRTAEDGRGGMKVFEADPPALVVTDIIMPTREGIETIIAMKRSRPDVPIVAISGGGRLGGVDFLKLADRLGADATLAKPFRLEELVTLARRCLAAASA
jgi:two-component system chemotaxis response regulator CheY